jgi:hydrogenase large subunit
MPETITIDPVVRIEGHLGIDVTVDKGEVIDAHTHGTLFRGAEIILIGRDPRDAPTITSYICGVCVSEHQIASTLSLENAAKVNVPRNAMLIRNIIEGATTLYSHLLHIFVLTGPDYDLYGLGNDKWAKLMKEVVIPVQVNCHQIVAIWGGRSPHYYATVAGGEGVVPTSEFVGMTLSRMNLIKRTVDEYGPLVLSYLDDHAELQEFGVGPRNFLSYGVYPDPDNLEERMLKRGVITTDVRQTLDVHRISEDVKHSWYSDRSGGHPADAMPPEPAYGKQGAYTWGKAPRYNGRPYEVGPLARMMVSEYYTPKSKHGASVYDRLMARLLETIKITEAMFDWAGMLKRDESAYEPYTTPPSASGVGLWEAPRGALGHWITINGGKIERYQVITPTAWNVSPRDDLGILGPIEQALVGVPVADMKNPLDVVRVVRSFDPCLACTVHLIDTNGRRSDVRIY